jgi:hypothetical protein
MTRRTTSQAKTDDQAFPIRVKLAIPHHDKSLWWGLSTRLQIWLNEIGPLRCVKHSGGWCLKGQAMALYFRTLEDAQACIAAFPELELADGVGSKTYYSPAVGASPVKPHS